MTSVFMSRKKKKAHLMEMVDEKVLQAEEDAKRKSELMEKKYVMNMLDTENIRQDMERKGEERKILQERKAAL